MGDDELMSELERRFCCCSLSSRVSCVMISDEGLQCNGRSKERESSDGRRRRRMDVWGKERDWIRDENGHAAPPQSGLTAETTLANDGRLVGLRLIEIDQ